jgi:hypothetical protein
MPKKCGWPGRQDRRELVARSVVAERYGVHVVAVMMTAKVHISVGAANEWLSVKCDYSYCTLQMSKAFS